jgi:ParB/RepB/Spo0J family partition protein
MKISLDSIKPNPFRDFELYPLDEEQINRLAQSIGELGFFASVAARPDGNGGYELAAGHHRIEAARRRGMNEVDANIERYDDFRMVQIMALENLTQRGHNAASTLDSIAAYARIVAKQVLLGEGHIAKNLAVSPQALGLAQSKIASDGPGKDLLYRAINGFDRKERKANKEAEIITETEISQSLGLMKESTLMGRIVAEAYAEVEAIREERDREAEARVERERTAAEKAERAATRKVEKERRTKEKEAVETQKNKAADYDEACGNIFRLTSHEAAFRTAVLTERGKRFFPVNKQLELAKRVRAQINTVEKKRSHDVGSTTIKGIIREFLDEAVREQKAVDESEKKRMLAESLRERINERWQTIRRGMLQAEAALINLIDDLKKWPEGEMMPFDMEVADRVIAVGKRFETFKQSMGDKHGQGAPKRTRITGRGTSPTTIEG